MIPKDALSQKRFFVLKGRTDITLNITDIFKRGIACMNLKSKPDCIMLTMLERMRLTCCVLPQGKALNIPCIIRSHNQGRRP